MQSSISARFERSWSRSSKPASAALGSSPSALAQKESDIMQFNSNDSGSSLQSEINITPLVDVVLVLLIIFMVVVPLLIEGYDVDIPRASADTSAQHGEEPGDPCLRAGRGDGHTGSSAISQRVPQQRTRHRLLSSTRNRGQLANSFASDAARDE